MSQRSSSAGGEAPAFADESATLASGEQPAEMGQRIVAAILDIIDANIATFVIALMAGLLFVQLAGGYGGGGQLVVYAVGAVTLLVYFVASEAMFGRTPGKALLGIHVIAVDGGAPGWGGAIVRNVLRVVDGLFLYLVGFLVAMTNEQRQRIGDLAAGTVVVED